MSQAKDIESILFKRVPGGYVYQPARPWIFGRASRYLVNEAQKVELLAAITPPRPWLRAAVVIGVFLGIVAANTTFMWAVTGHEDPTSIDAAVLLALVLVQTYLALVWAVRRSLRRTRAITATLPRTEERITARDLRKSMADAMSLRRAVLIGLCWSFTCAMQCVSLVIRNAQHPLLSDAQSFLSVFTAVLSIGLAAKYLVIAVRKLRQREAVA